MGFIFFPFLLILAAANIGPLLLAPWVYYYHPKRWNFALSGMIISWLGWAFALLNVAWRWFRDLPVDKHTIGLRGLWLAALWFFLMVAWIQAVRARRPWQEPKT